MNKTAIKNFAVWARSILINAVTQIAFEYEVTKDGKNAPAQTAVNGRTMTDNEFHQRSQLIGYIKENGFTQTMEEAAYTWFNRFIALRFMEVNNYLPSHTRLFSDESGAFKPEVLSDALDLEIEGLDRELVLEMLENQENEKLYKYIIITQCNALNSGLPEIFEGIGGWTELLFPNNLLRQGSIIDRMVGDIPEEDWLDQVQIIGWLYQYYNTEPKDKVFAGLKKNIKISAENIPAATQLFTPDWIVRYMVENSLGRLWADGHGKPDNAEWKYYLDEAHQEEQVKAELEKLREQAKNLKPEEIKFLDPCMGSGHILVYAFDVLMQIYTYCGWSERDAAKSILQHNLYGLDIDKRAFQLAYFALMMKARKYSRRILTSGVQPNLSHFHGVSKNNVNTDFLSGQLKKFVEQFEYADTYGSLMTVTVSEGLDDAISDYTGVIGIAPEQIEQMMRIYRILSQKYDVVVTNPPYMGGSNMNSELSKFVKKNFPDSKSDLFACFIEKCGQLIKTNGFYAMITQHAWMFLSSYENLRKKLMMKSTVNMAHLGARAFDEIGGEVVQTTAFVDCGRRVADFKGTYARLVDIVGENEKRELFLSGENRHNAKQENFSKIPGCPVAYWVSERFVNSFAMNKKLEDYGKTCQGLATGDNDRFLRLWFECDYTDVFWNCISHEESFKSSCKWYPCTKGGSFRRWYGNIEHLVDWYHDGECLKNFKGSVIRNHAYYFKKAYTWSTISSGKFSMRYAPVGSIFESKGSKCFVDDENFHYLLGLLNSCVAQEMLTFLAPTLDYHEGPVGRIPIKFPFNYSEIEQVRNIIEENIETSKQDWDSFETSWDFERNPLI